MDDDADKVLRSRMCDRSQLNNVLDLREKPNIEEAKKKLEEQHQKLTKGKERLYIEYADEKVD